MFQEKMNKKNEVEKDFFGKEDNGSFIVNL